MNNSFFTEEEINYLNSLAIGVKPKKNNLAV